MSLFPGNFARVRPRPPLKMQGVKRRADVSDIPVSKIGTDPDQPRKLFDDEPLDRLAESLKTRGQLQPIRVRWSEGRGGIHRDRRRETLPGRREGWPAHAGLYRRRRGDPARRVADHPMIENCAAGRSAADGQARAFRTLMDRTAGINPRLGEELRITQSAVTKALASLDLPAEVQEMVNRGDLDRSKAYELSKLDEPTDQVEIAVRVVAEGLSRDETGQMVRQVAGRQARAGGASRITKGRGASKGKPAEVADRADHQNVGRNQNRCVGSEGVR